jgi:hypothetical protein
MFSSPEVKAVSGETVVNDADKGIVTAITSVTGMKDKVNDIIVPGAYASVKDARPKVCKNHSWDAMVGKTLHWEELAPGHPDLPARLRAQGFGAVKAVMQFNLGSDQGRNTFADVKFLGPDQEWSIGYDAKGARAETKRRPDGTREIKAFHDLFEFSPVLVGAAGGTGTLDVKGLAALSFDAKAMLDEYAAITGATFDLDDFDVVVAEAKGWEPPTVNSRDDVRRAVADMVDVPPVWRPQVKAILVDRATTLGVLDEIPALWIGGRTIVLGGESKALRDGDGDGWANDSKPNRVWVGKKPPKARVPKGRSASAKPTLAPKKGVPSTPEQRASAATILARGKVTVEVEKQAGWGSDHRKERATVITPDGKVELERRAGGNDNGKVMAVYTPSGSGRAPVYFEADDAMWDRVAGRADKPTDRQVTVTRSTAKPDAELAAAGWKPEPHPLLKGATTWRPSDGMKDRMITVTADGEVSLWSGGGGAMTNPQVDTFPTVAAALDAATLTPGYARFTRAQTVGAKPGSAEWAQGVLVREAAANPSFRQIPVPDDNPVWVGGTRVWLSEAYSLGDDNFIAVGNEGDGKMSVLRKSPGRGWVLDGSKPT